MRWLGLAALIAFLLLIALLALMGLHAIAQTTAATG